MAGKLDPVMFDQLNKITWAIRGISFVNGDAEPERKAIQEDNLRGVLGEALASLEEKEFNDVIMIILGQILQKRLGIDGLNNLNNAIWELSQENQNEDMAGFLRGLSMRLKYGTCSIFRGTNSGWEIKGNVGKKEGPRKHYTLSPIPDRIRKKHEIKYSISRIMTQKTLGAYDDLIQEAQAEDNQRMVTHWEIQKELFLYLIQSSAYKLLEKPTEASKV